MISQTICNLSSQLSLIGNNINSKMFYSILEFVYEYKLGPDFITLYNRCLFKDELKDGSFEVFFPIYDLFKKDNFGGRRLELNKRDIDEIHNKSFIGKYINLTGKNGVVIDIIKSNKDEIWYCIYSSDFGEEFIREEHVELNDHHILDTRPFVNALLCDDNLGKYFKSFDNGKFEALK